MILNLETRFGRKAATAFIILSFSVTLLTSCNRKQGGGDALARVNGRKILSSEVDKYYNAQIEGTPAKPTAEQADSLRLSILRELIDNEILMQRAEKLGLMATDEEVQGKVNELKAPYTQEEFDKRLKDQGRTLDELKQDLRRSMTIDKVLNKEITSRIAVTDSDINGYYNAHKAEFNLIEPQYHLAWIVVSSQPVQVRNRKGSKAMNADDARKKIQMISNRLDSGDDFASVAMDYSEDPDSAPNGGDIGMVPESALKQQADPATREALLKLKPGQYSGIINSSDPRSKAVAFRIVKLISKEPAGQRDLNDPRVQQAIRDELRNRREQLIKAAYYDVLRDDAKVENFLAEQILKNSGQK
jgi:peptidyl-prolyl cis-trans isomerase SurA